MKEQNRKLKNGTYQKVCLQHFNSALNSTLERYSKGSLSSFHNLLFSRKVEGNGLDSTVQRDHYLHLFESRKGEGVHSCKEVVDMDSKAVGPHR